MGDLVNFPNWIFKKERDLEEREKDLAIERYCLERDKYNIKKEKSISKGKTIIVFCFGLACGLSLGLLSISI